MELYEMGTLLGIIPRDSHLVDLIYTLQAKFVAPQIQDPSTLSLARG